MPESSSNPPHANGILETSLSVESAGERSMLLLFRKGATPDTDAPGAMHIAFAIARSDLTSWENWLAEQGIYRSTQNAILGVLILCSPYASD